MKHAHVHSKSPRPGTLDLMRRPTAGPNGFAMAPPTYGIDFLDRQQRAEAEHGSTDVIVQRQIEDEDEEELLQGKFDSIQRQGPEDDELQMKKAPLAPAQFQPKPRSPKNNTGLPNGLKSGIESLSGLDLAGVHVHYNSPKPAQLQALAYTQGTDIHVAPGQEQHLPHEAWHVVQQAQGRVLPTMQIKEGVQINDDQGLEHEAEVMGTKAVQMRHFEKSAFEFPIHLASGHHQLLVGHAAVQCLFRGDPNLFPDVDNQCYVGHNAMKSKIVNAYKNWRKRYNGKQLYADEATGFIYGEIDNPYYVTPVEYQQILQWWIAKNTTTQDFTFVETLSASQNPNSPGVVQDLIAAPRIWQGGTSSKKAFNFHVRVK